MRSHSKIIKDCHLPNKNDSVGFSYKKKKYNLTEEKWIEKYKIE